MLIIALAGFRASVMANTPNGKALRNEEPGTGNLMVEDLLSMDNDSDYFHSPLKNIGAIRDRLEEEGFEGLIIGGPSKVPSEGERFPIVAIRATDALNIALRVIQRKAKDKEKVGAVIVYGSYRLPSPPPTAIAAQRMPGEPSDWIEWMVSRKTRPVSSADSWPIRFPTR